MQGGKTLHSRLRLEGVVPLCFPLFLDPHGRVSETVCWFVSDCGGNGLLFSIVGLILKLRLWNV